MQDLEKVQKAAGRRDAWDGEVNVSQSKLQLAERRYEPLEGFIRQNEPVKHLASQCAHIQTDGSGTFQHEDVGSVKGQSDRIASGPSRKRLCEFQEDSNSTVPSSNFGLVQAWVKPFSLQVLAMTFDLPREPMWERMCRQGESKVGPQRRHLDSVVAPLLAHAGGRKNHPSTRVSRRVYSIFEYDLLDLNGYSPDGRQKTRMPVDVVDLLSLRILQVLELLLHLADVVFKCGVFFEASKNISVVFLD